MSKVLRGTVHGKFIELEEESGLPKGQPVTIVLQPVHLEPTSNEIRLKALKRAAGTWTDDPDGLNHFLVWNRLQRKIRRRELPT